MLRSDTINVTPKRVSGLVVYILSFSGISLREIDERAAALTYPMLLLSLDVWEIVNVLEALKSLSAYSVMRRYQTSFDFCTTSLWQISHLPP